MSYHCLHTLNVDFHFYFVYQNIFIFLLHISPQKYNIYLNFNGGDTSSPTPKKPKPLSLNAQDNLVKEAVYLNMSVGVGVYLKE